MNYSHGKQLGNPGGWVTQTSKQVQGYTDQQTSAGLHRPANKCRVRVTQTSKQVPSYTDQQTSAGLHK